MRGGLGVSPVAPYSGGMTHMFRHLLAALALIFVAAAPACAQLPDNPQGPTEAITITSGDKTHTFQVELADTDAETSMGLMNRAQMARDHGMIFDFGQPRETGMWMKNTLIPLDMLFLDTDGTVLAVAHNARPHSLRLITPGFAVKGVLEVNGGVAKELGLKPGDVVKHRMFGNP
jgi:uncharacterized membrane protein (UPF0127 family)